jgi:transcriptional regulator with XRE-family HTH domain
MSASAKLSLMSSHTRYRADRLPEKLTRLIETTGAVGKDIADAMDAHESKVSKFKTGESMPSFRQLVILGKFFRVPVDFFIDDEMDDPSDAPCLRDRPESAPPPPAPSGLTESEQILIKLARQVGVPDAVEALMNYQLAAAAPRAARDAAAGHTLSRADEAPIRQAKAVPKGKPAAD